MMFGTPFFFPFWREATFIGTSEIVFAGWRKHENTISHSHLSLQPLTKTKYSMISFFKMKNNNWDIALWSLILFLCKAVALLLSHQITDSSAIGTLLFACLWLKQVSENEYTLSKLVMALRP